MDALLGITLFGTSLGILFGIVEGLCTYNKYSKMMQKINCALLTRQEVGTYDVKHSCCRKNEKKQKIENCGYLELEYVIMMRNLKKSSQFSLLDYLDVKPVCVCFCYNVVFGTFLFYTS